MKNDKIPFLDLVSQHSELKEELLGVVERALSTAQFVGGAEVEGFELEYADYCESGHCVGVANGTDAVRFALIASGVQPGETVITTPFTFIATTEAVSQAGGRIEFVDVDERTCNLDPVGLQAHLESNCDWNGRDLISRKHGSRIAAIVPVHLYGQMADMDPILELADRYGLLVVEDAAQAQGASYNSRKTGRWHRAGSMGHAASFSFYPGKNLGACGEAGAVTTGSPEIARKVRMLRDHGQASKYYHEFEGYNGRLDAIQAGFLRIKLRHLEAWNSARRAIADQYAASLADTAGLTRPHEPEWSRAVYHQYVVRHSKRDELQRHLESAGVSSGLHYPVALHEQQAYRHLGYAAGDFPMSEQAAREVLSLPIDPGLTPEDVSRVVTAVSTFDAVEVG